MKKGIFLFFLAFYLMCAPGHFNATDGVSVYLTTKNLVENGSLGQQEYSIEESYLPILFPGKDGRFYGKNGIGQSLLSVPLYLLGRLGDKILPQKWKTFFAGPDYHYWGGTLTIFAVSTFCQLITPLVLVVFYLCCQRLGFSKSRSLTLVFILGLATLFWSNSRDYFQHPLTILLLLSSIYVLLHPEKVSPRHFLYSGTLLGFDIIVRPVQIINCLPLIAFACWRSRTIQPIRSGRYMLMFLGPLVTGILIQCLVNYLRFGGLFAFGGYDQWNAFLPSNILAGLYVYTWSLGHGLFIYAPPVMLGLFCIKMMWRHRKSESILFISLVLINLAWYACLPNKHLTDFGIYGLWCYGPRYLLSIIPFLILPLGYYRPHLKTGGMPVWILAIIGILIQIPGVLVSYAFVLNALHSEFRLLGTESSAIEHITLYHPQYCLLWQNTRHLIRGEFVDLWLLNGLHTAGILPFVISLTVLCGIGALGLFFIKKAAPSFQPDINQASKQVKHALYKSRTVIVGLYRQCMKVADQKTTTGKHSFSLRKKVCYSSLIFLTFFMLLEFIVKVSGLGPGPTLPGMPDSGPSDPALYQPAHQRMYKLRANSSGTYRSSIQLDNEFVINSYGFRGPPVTKEKPGSTFRIICMGDSCTFGEGLGEKELPYPRLLEIMLNETSPGLTCEVINAGVPGYTTIDGIYWLMEGLLDFSPDLVTVLYGWNDHWQTNRPNYETAKGNARFITINDLLNKLDSYRFLSRIIYTIKWRQLKKEVQKDFREFRLDVVPAEYKMNLENIIYRVRDSGAHVLLMTSPSGLVGGNIPQYLLKSGAVRNLDTLPLIHETYNEVVRETAREQNTLFLDLAALFEGRENDYFTNRYIDPIHPNSRGYQRIARELSEMTRPLLRNDN